MTLYIGKNLKKQRKLRELTQEQLAQILGVSFQSVSKWERNEGYPDIEMLPMIANYFGITIDELMGMDTIRDDSDVEKILDKVCENASKGMIEENIALLENAAKRFPNNYAILEKYADSLTFVNWDMDGENILDGDDLLYLQQSNMLSLTELMYMTLTLMTREDNPAYTPEEKIRIKKKAIAVYEIIFEDGDFNFYAHNLSYVYRQIAMIAMSEGDHALALESLEKSADYAIENDKLPCEKTYTSLVVNKMKHNTGNTMTNIKTSFSEELLSHMSMSRYDAIRNEPRFKAAEQRLTNPRR